ncbi:scarecrow-like protein 30 [Quercus robur]|uniref:scarecrow-like protein 30 n=1 Tax=Quercus robur TaxID=38942 RepID=UPI002161473B|nr:scarecrow-like protein 30 [Quercus robur]
MDNLPEDNHEFVPDPFLPNNTQHPIDSSPSMGTSLGGEPSYTSDPSVLLKYINEMLMEEDLEARPRIFQDSLALEAAEKSFYEVLGQEDHPLTDQNNECPDALVAGNSRTHISNSYSVADNLIKSSWSHDQGESNSFCIQTSLIDSQSENLLLPNSFSEMHSFAQDKGGMGIAVKSIRHGKYEVFDLESIPPVPPKYTQGMVGKQEKSYTSPSGSRGNKNHQREDTDNLEEGRSNKHSLVDAGEVDSELLEKFDKILCCPGGDSESASSALHKSGGNGGRKKLQHNNHSKGSHGKTMLSKNEGKKGVIVDFWGLLTQCAQAVASSDQKTANELLNQIRQHSSPLGDRHQRLAHYFANALEARLAGTRIPVYTALESNGTSVADYIKAYQLCITVCPFKRMSNFFANQTIRKLAEAQKATTLHIIDFGILYGLQWPCLIQRLSIIPGGPLKLRITGIELPQPGFRPAERIEETGRRLENYCKRINVPFEYNAIAQKWETIRLEDLKIDRDELTVVNCMYRLKNIPDETVAINCPRDIVLNLIKRINPDLFVHGVVNGAYNAPFFLTRFREALFHYSALFDMFDATMPREDHQRLQFEEEGIGRGAMNVIACEGLERVERPETFDRWEVRTLRAGFRQLPIDEEVVLVAKKAVKSEYHKDFVIYKDGQWMLQGWKGRINYAISCWKPA